MKYEAAQLFSTLIIIKFNYSN